LILSAYLYRILYAIIVVGPAAIVTKLLKSSEKIDVYDNKTNFNPFKMKAK
jgi:hypothetical protein